MAVPEWFSFRRSMIAAVVAGAGFFVFFGHWVRAIAFAALLAATVPALIWFVERGKH